MYSEYRNGIETSFNNIGKLVVRRGAANSGIYYDINSRGEFYDNENQAAPIKFKFNSLNFLLSSFQEPLPYIRRISFHPLNRGLFFRRF